MSALNQPFSHCAALRQSILIVPAIWRLTGRNTRSSGGGESRCARRRSRKTKVEKSGFSAREKFVDFQDAGIQPRARESLEKARRDPHAGKIPPSLSPVADQPAVVGSRFDEERCRYDVVNRALH